MRAVSLDFECSGLDYYSPDFEVVSMALSWIDDAGDLKNAFYEGQEMVHSALKILETKEVEIIVHNLTYESGVLMTQFPDIHFPVMWDTQRLVQVGDSGAYLKRYESRYNKQGGVPRDGKSLEASVSRWLPERYHNHKQKFYDYLQSTYRVSRKECGQYLHKLPPDMLREYNVSDTDVTLLLYNELIKTFKQEGYTGYILDHQLYRERCKQVAKAYVVGVEVDREQAEKAVQLFGGQMEEASQEFLRVNAEAIAEVIRLKQEAYINDPKVKTDSGRAARKRRIEEGVEFSGSDKVNGFSTSSPKDLFLLFNKVMGIETPFLTRPDKQGNGGGNPSFAKHHLKAWHPTGALLVNQGTLRIAKNQTESLLELSARTGRWQLDMNPTATKTGRLGGGANNE